ncbi:hypothetical protein [Aquisalimonas asiatica]|uniref:hypothetical protein n=1 Tax=Aquisalimonas asiatica TaxID=406100 RepID=UPI0011142B6B
MEGMLATRRDSNFHLLGGITQPVDGAICEHPALAALHGNVPVNNGVRGLGALIGVLVAQAAKHVILFTVEHGDVSG